MILPQSFFRSFRSRNYRLYFAGQGISLIGTWMQMLAMSWLVYRISRSAFILGSLGFFSQLPNFFLTPFTGVLADRWNRRRIVVATQTLFMIQALLLALLVFAGWVSVWLIIALSMLMGIINAFDAPARQSLVVQIVDRREDLGNAIALNSVMFNGARLIGPSIAGILIALIGEGLCFLLNGLSYLAVLGALLAMRLPPQSHSGPGEGVLRELKEGLTYAWGMPPIRRTLALLVSVSFLGLSFTTLLPLFAEEILHSGAHGLGFLLGAMGSGALAGATYMASRKSSRGLRRHLATSAAVLGASLIGFSFSSFIWLSLLLMVFVGLGMITMMISCNTFLQSIVADDKRARVMGLYVMAFMGTTPFGSLLVGSMATLIGVRWTVFIGGCSCLASAAVFGRRLVRSAAVEGV